MSPKPDPHIVPDADKTREQLLSEVQGLRAQVAILREAETKSKRTSEALRESEARSKVAEAVEAERRRLFDVLEKLPVMICLLTQDYHVAFANRSYRERFGDSHGLHCYEYCFGRAEPCEFCEAYIVLKTGQPHRWKVKGPDDSLIEVYNAPFTDVDGSLMILKMSVDITERKRVEEALQKSEASLARAQLLAHIGNWSWDLGTNELEYSDECYRLLGYKPGEIRPVTFDFFISHIHPDDKDLFLRAIRESIQGVKPFSIDFRLVKPDGTIVYMHDDGEVQYDARGNPVRMFGTVQDITERKLAEEAMEKSKEQAELYLDLMGHDISNIHQIMEGQLELAQEIMAEAGKLEGDEKELIDTPLEILIRSNKLIENVRKLQKMEAGEYRSRPVDIGELLCDVVATYSDVPGKDLSIDYTPVHGCYMDANPLLKDVFVNLVDNAVKHSDGPVHIDIKVDKIAEDGRAYYRVAVEDDGPGIPDEKKGEIFHRFKRGRTMARGTGLGLYIVKTLVEGFQGCIKVEDRIQGDRTKGARFVVMLPIVEK